MALELLIHYRLMSAIKNTSFSSNRLVLAGFLLALLILSLVGALFVQSGCERAQADYWVEQSQQNLLTIEGVYSDLKDAESAERGYVLTRDVMFLRQYDSAVRNLNKKLPALSSTASGSPDQQPRVDTLISMVKQRMADIDSAIEERKRGSIETATQIIVADRDVRDVAALWAAIRDKKAAEISLMAQRKRHSDEVHEKMKLSFTVLLLFTLSTLIAGFVRLRREQRHLRVSQCGLEDANKNLQRYLDDANHRAKEVETLNELGEMLQASISFQEAYALFNQFFPRLFPEDAGALIIVSPSRKLLGVAAQEKEIHVSNEVTDAETCWALRRGKPHCANGSSGTPVCQHASECKGEYVCLPLVANGESIGVLHMEGSFSETESRKLVIAHMLAEQYSLALGNLRLRENLREQSIRDPLTGLFNRRYMEESLEREMARSKRSRTSLAVMMLDLDHFKTFNDTYGHEAGDLLLREFGSALRFGTRTEDIVCRYGGEEFTVVLPGADESGARHRAEQIRHMTKKLEIKAAGKLLPQVSISIGVAIQEGASVSDLLRTADSALYQAKALGRDCIVFATKLESRTKTNTAYTPSKPTTTQIGEA
jgi:diguanylate cyclase (GGDEF)-like protein